MPLYAYILLGSILIPFMYSFFIMDFIKKWKSFTLSTLLIGSAFIVWDVIFTKFEIWGFNATYLLGFTILYLPLEEWLFFIVIPFCSLFIHFSFFYLFPNFKLNKRLTQIISFLLMAIALTLVITNYDKCYTLVNFSLLFIILLAGLLVRVLLLQQFFFTFLIILVPFFIVNGMLTGTITEDPIVWYDNTQNLGIRLITIPIEDIGYAFSMLFGNLLLFDLLETKNGKIDF